MNNKLIFYICRHCGNIIVKLEDSGVPVVCCGEQMQELLPGTVDATIEKHVPEVEIINDEVIVKIGKDPHPMVPEHYISWILIVTNSGYQIKYIKDNSEAIAVFKTNEKVLAAYEYCNLHGLWVKEID
ncbi:MAG: desulfoferrodoxin family protein [Bacilli bacterium]|nr:desulfoferrodoxin family protein [Bacilli bacterium]